MNFRMREYLALPVRVLSQEIESGDFPQPSPTITAKAHILFGHEFHLAGRSGRGLPGGRY